MADVEVDPDLDLTDLNEVEPTEGDTLLGARDNISESFEMAERKSKRPLAERGATKDDAMNISSTSSRRGSTEISFIDGVPEPPGSRTGSAMEREKSQEEAWRIIRRLYPVVDHTKFTARINDIGQVLIKLKRRDAKEHPLFIGYKINEDSPKTIRDALGQIDVEALMSIQEEIRRGYNPDGSRTPDHDGAGGSDQEMNEAIRRYEEIRDQADRITRRIDDLRDELLTADENQKESIKNKIRQELADLARLEGWAEEVQGKIPLKERTKEILSRSMVSLWLQY